MQISYQQLGFGITCIDTLLHRPGLACCYLIENEGMAGFIDTGTNNSIPILLEVLRRKGISRERVAYLMPTHVHLDHAGGSGGLMQEFPNAELLVHPRGARHLIDPTRLAQGSEKVYGPGALRDKFGELHPVAAERVREMPDESELDFNGRKLLFLDTPGHARHHYCIYDELSQGVFTGDSFGASYPELNYGRARFIFPPSTPVQFDPPVWIATLDRLMSFKPSRIFVTHFGMHEEVDVLAEQLKRGIKDYADTALEFVAAENREERICQAILQASINYLLDQQCGLDVPAIKQLIQLDMELNAKGLEHWLVTRESQ